MSTDLKNLMVALGGLLVVAAGEPTCARGDVTPAAATASHKQDLSADDSRQISELIAALGSDRYVDRRRAQQDLVRMGVDAFDDIQAAVTNPDPEVSSAVQFILGQISIPWVADDDPPQIRQAMRRFSESSDSQRLRIIRALSNESDAASIKALCRIVRFDMQEHVSRTAAMAVLRPTNPRSEPLPYEPSLLRELLGDSQRRGSTWLRLYSRQLEDPASTLPRWKEELAIEIDQHREHRLTVEQQQQLDQDQQLRNRQFDLSELQEATGESYASITTSEVVVELAWHLFNLQRQSGRIDGALATFDRLVEFEPEEFDHLAIDTIDWLVELEAWEQLDRFLASHDERLATARRAQYAAAIALREQGREGDAEDLAERARQVPVEEQLERILDAGDFLLSRQCWNWAEQEYRHVLAAEPMESQWALYARFRLADLLHDWQRDGAAAEELETLENHIDAETEFRKSYNLAKREFFSRYGVELASPKQISAQRNFYAAGHAHAEEDWEAERELLLKARKLDPSNPDVLIAMYRVPESDQQWQRDVQEWIVEMAQGLEKEIQQAPDDESTRDAYNQWAWLIGNTEGDYQKAIRYSHKSLELSPNSPSLLDTLGRCYYAADDYENAVKYQRRAVELEPSMQVMHRQLELFESALAEQQAQ